MTRTSLNARCACGAPLRVRAARCERCAERALLRIDDRDSRAEREADRIARASADDGAPLSAFRVRERPACVGGRRSGAEPAGGRPLDTATRGWFEPRFGHDLGHIRIHDDAEASASTRALRARAYTVGSDLVFRAGQLNPRSAAGKRLLAHELAHSVQQRDGLAVQRAPDEGEAAAPAPADPLCASFDLKATRADVDKEAEAFKATKDPLPLIRRLKRIRRCASATDQQAVRAALDTAIGTGSATAAWDAAGTAFGGYVGYYPGFAPDIKSHLTRLGTSESLSSGSFETSAEASVHRARAKAAGAGERGDLGRTDIVYFRGHQYAQYRAPGMFANGSETRGFDLRYVQQAGGFANVKLMISTSCATLCKEALEVFTSLFPNAVILGYRKSAPIDGAAVREDLTKRINALNRPLLVDEPVDVAAIISTWKSVIEARHKGETAPVPGYYQGGNVEYWDGAAWGTIPGSDAANACRRKGDFRAQYPAP